MEVGVRDGVISEVLLLCLTLFRNPFGVEIYSYILWRSFALIITTEIIK